LVDAPFDSASIGEWQDWFFDFLSQNPEVLMGVLRRGSRSIFRGAIEELGEWDVGPGTLASEVEAHLRAWMDGASLADIEAMAIDRGLTRGTTHFNVARKFVLRVVPDVAFLFGLPALVARAVEELPTPEPASAIANLAACVEEGLNTLAQLSLLRLNPIWSRSRVHRETAS
jgi:hypothetical protein